MTILDGARPATATRSSATLCVSPTTYTRPHARPRTDTAVLDPDLHLVAEDLSKLFDDSQALVHLPGALSPRYCAGVVAAAAAVPFQAYAKTENSSDFAPILKFGPALFDYIGATDVSGYFIEGAAATALGAAAFAASAVLDPLTAALRALRRAWPGRVEVATESDGRPYFAGVMRDIPSGALPHVDHARVETPALQVGRTIAQASMLFYVSIPTAGGALRVYDKTPTATDYADHTLGYGFTADAVRDATFRGITPGVGSVVLFPTTQIHSVDPVAGPGHRITWSTFIGLCEDGSLVLWS
ncbi:2OG-Fe(II) oxygenase [Mycolicibacterium sp. S3B2]|uniref:2OG-Fe(II) oxygenase n=1 Tax=Mycolicibacterium sp. S3B2 TaxID=3415120 RepID=UPI003C7B4C37